jgi:hypothetical protein
VPGTAGVTVVLARATATDTGPPQPAIHRMSLVTLCGRLCALACERPCLCRDVGVHHDRARHAG